MAELRRRKGDGDNRREEEAAVELKRSSKIDQTFTTFIMALSVGICAVAVLFTMFPDCGAVVSMLKGTKLYL